MPANGTNATSPAWMRGYSVDCSAGISAQSASSASAALAPLPGRAIAMLGRDSA